MPFWIEGWIEVKRPAPDAAWFGAVNLGTLVEISDDDSERLFGLSKDCVTGRKEVESLAAGRGVPPDSSGQVARELQANADHEAEYGPGEVGGYTHALWTEIRGHRLADPPPDYPSQWAVPFAIARVLEEEFGPKGVRFVVWFNW